MTEEQKKRLDSALAKREGGYGMKNSEIAMVRAFDRGRISEHFDRLKSAPFSPPTMLRSLESTTVERVDGLAEKLRGGRGGEETDYESRIAALEALLTGLTRKSITYCSGGSSSTKTILMS